MKKTILCLSILAMLLCGFAKTKDVITIWEGWKFEEETIFNELMEDFEKDFNQKHPDQLIDIQTKRVSFDDMITKIKMACLSRDTPDIAFVDALKVLELAYGKVLYPMDVLDNFPYADYKECKKEYVPAAFETNVIDIKGKVNLYGLPAQTSTLCLFWNKDLFKKYAAEIRAVGMDPERAPETWDEFVLYGKALTHPEEKKYGYAIANSLWFTFPIINTYNGEVVTKDKDGKWSSNFDSPGVSAALQRNIDFYLKDGIEAGAWQSGAIGHDQGFVNESYAMIMMGPWNVERFKSAGLNFGISQVPKVSKKEAVKLGLLDKNASDEEYNQTFQSSSNIGGANGVIFRTCKRPEIAYEIIAYFSSEKIQRFWAEKLGQIPVNLKAQKDLNLESFPEVPLFIRQINLAKPMPKIPLYGTLENDIFNPEMDLVLQGKEDLDTALIKINAKFKRLIIKAMNE